MTQLAMNSGAARFLPGWLLRSSAALMALMASVLLGVGMAHAQAPATPSSRSAPTSRAPTWC